MHCCMESLNLSYTNNREQQWAQNSPFHITTAAWKYDRITLMFTELTELPYPLAADHNMSLL